MRLAPALCVAAAVALPTAAAAHVEMTSPAQRYPATNQYLLEIKDGPCGLAANPPGEVERTVFAPGETITVTWDEYIPHPGHFRVAFDDDGDDDLLDPSDFNDYNTPGVTVLMDAIPHEDGKSDYSVEVTLPDIECTNCTLQLIQVMTDKPPWGPEGGKDIYYQCADLVLQPLGGTGSSGGDTTDGSSTSSTSTTTTSGSGSDTAGTSSSTTSGSTSGGSTSDTDGTSGGETGDAGSSGCRVNAQTPAASLALLLPALGFLRRRAAT